MWTAVVCEVGTGGWARIIKGSAGGERPPFDTQSSDKNNTDYPLSLVLAGDCLMFGSSKFLSALCNCSENPKLDIDKFNRLD